MTNHAHRSSDTHRRLGRTAPSAQQSTDGSFKKSHTCMYFSQSCCWEICNWHEVSLQEFSVYPTRHDYVSRRRRRWEHHGTLIPFRNHSDEFLSGSSSLTASQAGFKQTPPTPHNSHMWHETKKHTVWTSCSYMISEGGEAKLTSATINQSNPASSFSTATGSTSVTNG